MWGNEYKSIVSIGSASKSRLAILSSGLLAYQGSSATSFQFIFVTDCQPHPTVYRRWPSFSGCRCSRLNSLPDLVTSALSAAVFRSRLKTHLFNITYPSPLWLYIACVATLHCFGHDNRSSLLTYLYELISPYQPSHSLWCSNQLLLTVPRANLNRSVRFLSLVS